MIAAVTSSREQPVVGAFLIPLWCRFEVTGCQEMLLHNLVVEGDTQTWLVRHHDESPVDDWLIDSFDKRIPPRHIHGVVFHCQEVVRGGYGMYSRHARHRGASEVHGHSDAIFFGH